MLVRCSTKCFFQQATTKAIWSNGMISLDMSSFLCVFNWTIGTDGDCINVYFAIIAEEAKTSGISYWPSIFCAAGFVEMFEMLSYEAFGLSASTDTDKPLRKTKPTMGGVKEPPIEEDSSSASYSLERSSVSVDSSTSRLAMEHHVVYGYIKILTDQRNQARKELEASLFERKRTKLNLCIYDNSCPKSMGH
ncbi:uncharacterized protein LOC121996200 isoform X2 [Zingiber officinale]|uniref:uncharacterized protein LOC121996200 isoform X2 n=1 Tax=Zingiber officinale TaxID=94328 RepID=UPI001C4BD3E5|nr:uncharacterized protein LOC121996200 isoform X2 [Zingiber officinale]